MNGGCYIINPIAQKIVEDIVNYEYALVPSCDVVMYISCMNLYRFITPETYHVHYIA